MTKTTKQTSTSQSNQTFNQSQQNQYDPQSMSRYQQMQGQATGVLSDYMQNPLTASFFNTQVGMANRQLGRGAQSGVAQMMNNLGPGMQGSPIMQALLAQHQRSFTGQRAGAFQNLLMQAQQVRQWATNQAAGMNPLQTGMTSSGAQSATGSGTQTTKTSGLGSWLPQLVGGALGVAGSMATGGAEKAKPPSGGGGYKDYEP